MLKLESDPSFLDSHTTLEIALILGGVAIGALVIAAVAFRIRSRWLLAAALVLGVVQLFGPFGFTSAALLVTCTLLPVAFWRRREDLRNLRSPATIWALLLAALAAWQVVSVLWSAKVGAAGYGVIFSVALLTAYLLARDVVDRDAQGIPAAIAAASPFVIVSALLVIVFRISPTLEASYLLSPIARLFSEPDVALVTRSEIDIALDPLGSLGVFSDVARPPGAAGGLLAGLFDSTTLTNFQNVLDPTKAGGVFLNGNTASLFFAVVACVSAWAMVRGRLRVLHAITAVSAIAAIVATGSKTALLLLVGLPLLALLIAFAVRRPRAGAITGSAIIAAGVAAVVAVLAIRPSLLSSGTLSDRFTLWRMVADAFPDHFFLGFGFGNWRDHIVDEWTSYFPGVATQIWPPHNLILQAWVDAGIVALILTLAIVALPLIGSVRRIGEARRDPLFGGRSIGTGIVFVALAWVLLHGMADTTFFAGDNHTLPFVALLSAVALTPSSKLKS
ncbi:MAG: O-antigen ligase family protein [Microbacterium gubbeenense]|uniref:O-antigen ligase family protein n=1 Tax=Microbacterium gubbeenense TaxID=159896 RepID=UPI003F94C1CE